MTEKVFRTIVNDALEFIKQTSEESFDKEDTEAQKKMQKYVQKVALRADEYDSFVILEGSTFNKSRVHFGNTTQGNFSLIKKTFIKGKYVPLLSDNGLRGVVNHELRVMSKNMGLGDDLCGLFDEKGKKRFECGKCIRCGIMGFLSLKKKTVGQSKNMPHRLAIRSFLPEMDSIQIIQEYHNSLDDAVGTVYTPVTTSRSEEDEDNFQDEGKAANFYVMEYLAPGGRFPIMLTMRGMAIAEMGLALMSVSKAWYTLGVGRHKNGALTTWEQEMSDWKLTYDPLLSEKETYTGEELEELINDIKRVAYIAIKNNLFQEYSIAEIARKPIDKPKKKKATGKKKEKKSKEKKTTQR
ncbi:MAG: hypothetical protein GF308_16020 [Candidatus Heimdallarchaeota archaeon]|nr:hypothetical protein [Candidatus Heimdallarchaeota archaeon]